jgi:hypothetical protein
MKLITLIFLLFFPFKDKIKLDFGKEENKVKDWYILSDDVMGGLSTYKLNYLPNSLEFSGNISFKNNGGFVSLRSNFDNYDLSNYTNVLIRFRSKNQKFALLLENSKSWWEPNYKYEFQSKPSSEWEIVNINLMDFHEEIIGKKTGKLISKSTLKDICRIGIITNDKKEGSFSLEIDYIEFLVKGKDDN